MSADKHAPAPAREEGFALVFITVVMVALLLGAGLAIDAGRAYLVKAELSKAVDAAALGAARMLNSGDPRAEAEAIFKANFKPGYMGTPTATDPTAAPGFFEVVSDEDTAVNTVTVRATVRMPTLLMSLANIDEVRVASTGEATRRTVDLCLVLDTSHSIGSQWGAVRDAARAFAQAFDEETDRFCLVRYSFGATVIVPMRDEPGFDKSAVINGIPNSLPGGGTAMAEGLYRGWDEIRTVPAGRQSSLRVIVLFTDGAANVVPGIYPGSPVARGLWTSDFPEMQGQIQGLFSTNVESQTATYTASVNPWSASVTLPQVPFLPARSTHIHHRSAGIPTSFDLQSDMLTVNGLPQSQVRGLRPTGAAPGTHRADPWNISNAARNLLEIIANEVRNDTGDYRIRIYTIGMGEFLRLSLGTMPEQPEQMMIRIANVRDSPDYNASHLAGKYYFAATAADVGPAFQELQNDIIRLTR